MFDLCRVKFKMKRKEQKQIAEKCVEGVRMQIRKKTLFVQIFKKNGGNDLGSYSDQTAPVSDKHIQFFTSSLTVCYVLCTML